MSSQVAVRRKQPAAVSVYRRYVCGPSVTYVSFYTRRGGTAVVLRTSHVSRFVHFCVFFFSDSLDSLIFRPFLFVYAARVFSFREFSLVPLFVLALDFFRYFLFFFRGPFVPLGVFFFFFYF